MNRKFRVTGKSRFDHNFEIGNLVELVKIYEDNVYEVRGRHFMSEINQDMHPCDLEEIFDEEATNVMELQDRFIFDGEVLAELCKDVDGDYFVRYFNNSNLYLGAVKLLAQWEFEMYEKYKEM